MEKTCYIAGAGDNTGTDFKINEGDCVIAADGGVKILEKLNITPDYILGDFDSLGYVPKGDNVIRYKVRWHGYDAGCGTGNGKRL